MHVRLPSAHQTSWSFCLDSYQFAVTCRIVVYSESDEETTMGSSQLHLPIWVFSSPLTDIFIAIGVQCSALHRQEGIYQPNDVVMVEPVKLWNSYFVWRIMHLLDIYKHFKGFNNIYHLIYREACIVLLITQTFGGNSVLKRRRERSPI